MFRKVLLPLVAAAGLVIAISTSLQSSKPVPAAAPVAEPASAPFEAYVAGAGIVEACTENIAVGTPIPGLVTKVFVQVGAKVSAGEPLFALDDRDLQAERKAREAAVVVAEQELVRLRAFPRAEDVPPAEAILAETAAALKDLEQQLALWDSVSDKRAVSEDELNRKRYAVESARARRDAASANLARLRAGSWQADIDVALAHIEQARAQLEKTKTDIERMVIRAQVDADVLQVKIRPGEYAAAGVLVTPLMLIGDLRRMQVRVDVDENDAWRIQSAAKAVIFVRGNRALTAPVAFARIEPYVVPKLSLTGESIERVDTRVLQVLYQLERPEFPLYVGQQVDVFIETSASGL